MNTTAKNIFEMKVKSSTENLGVIRQFVEEKASQSGIDKSIIDKIVLAVDEACTNIIKHAYNYDASTEFVIRVLISKEEFKVLLIDHGKSFDPSQVADPDMPTYLKQRRVGGLGLHLMRHLMDTVEYHNLEGNGNQLILTKKIA
ncbi:MAG: ATP-binding protein [Ignavibacteriaceae bacterium]|nr:ATP-binding protein [Ignavibacteriaceae bacterium]